MEAAHGAERLATAQSEVRRACRLLTAPTPEALDNCQEALASAVNALREFRCFSQEVPPGPATRPLALTLKAEVLRAGRLLESLATFYKGWERILGSMSGGYTSNGAPAAVTRPGRLCCRG
jgi:hypothetical protein